MWHVLVSPLASLQLVASLQLHLLYDLLCSILNDVVLNKRTTITDEAALKDAKRSLKAMLNDFLTQHW